MSSSQPVASFAADPSALQPTAPEASARPDDHDGGLASPYPPPVDRVDGGDRAVAAGAYIAAVGLAAWALMPSRQFPQRHTRLAVGAHLLRFVWVGGTLAVWQLFAGNGDASERVARLSVDLSMLAITGVPWLSTFSSGALAWIAAPLAVCWALSLAGFLLAASGRTADFYAFAHADWSEATTRRRWLWQPPEVERRQARLARERQIERIQKTNRAVSAERARRDRMDELKFEIERLQAERSHIDQLLSIGEISRKRHTTLTGELDAEIGAVREQLAELSSRVVMASSAMPERLRVSRLDRSGESRANTVALVTPSGVPIFTYGQFQLDDALVAGMLSAFDSLSEEVFGSRVHKTELAEGQVMHFVHGQHAIVVAIFAEEPSPRQIEQLRTLLQQFEAANAGPLARKDYDPAYLHEVAVPFRFRERLSRGE